MSDDLEWMIERQLPHLRRYAYALTRDRETADDLVQDTLERALRKRHLWTRRGSLRSWLFRILYRRCADHFRRSRPNTVPADEEMIDRAVSQPAAQEDHLSFLEIGAALERLPSEQRATLLLAALEGMPYDEIGRVTDVPIGTVRSRLSRAREALRGLRNGEPEGRPQARLRMVK